MLFTEYNYAEDIAVQREEARKQGLTQGIAQGILKNLIKLVKKNLLTLEIASQEANMSQEEFSKLLAQSN